MDSTRAMTKRGDEEGQHELEMDQKQIEKQPTQKHMTLHVCGGYMSVHGWRLHDCTCVCGGYMTIHVCVEAT